MTVTFGEKLKNLMIDLDLHRGPFTGCTPAEIEEIRVAQQVDRIPGVYHQCLETLGRCGFTSLVGDLANYPDVLEFKKDAIKLLNEYKQIVIKKNLDKVIFDLPPDALVYAFHDQGVHFVYFCTQDTGDDPPIYSYVGMDGTPEKVQDNLSTSLINLAKSRAAFFKKLRETRLKNTKPRNEETQ